MRSPRDCFTASAARSGSWSAPSAMTRSTASESCSRICAGVISGMAGSPRRSSARRPWAASIAASPPFTATYIGLALQHRAARQSRDAVAGREEDIDAEREARVILAPFAGEVGVDARHAESRAWWRCRDRKDARDRRRSRRRQGSASRNGRDNRRFPPREATRPGGFARGRAGRTPLRARRRWARRCGSGRNRRRAPTAGSSQSGVSASTSASRIAAAAGSTPAGGAQHGARVSTQPGSAIARSNARNTCCAASTG